MARISGRFHFDGGAVTYLGAGILGMLITTFTLGVVGAASAGGGDITAAPESAAPSARLAEADAPVAERGCDLPVAGASRKGRERADEYPTSLGAPGTSSPIEIPIKADEPIEDAVRRLKGMPEYLDSIGGIENLSGLDSLLLSPLTGVNQTSSDRATRSATTSETPKSSEPSDASQTTDAAADSELPLFEKAVDAEDARSVQRFGRFMEAHVNEVVGLDALWSYGSAALFDATEPGRLTTQPNCIRGCPAGVIGSLELALDGLSGAPDHTFDWVGSEMRMTGTWFVLHVEIGTGGTWVVHLRDHETNSEEVGAPSTALQGNCRELENRFMDYPRAPLSSGDASRFDAHVRLVQDILNALGYGCLSEDGYFGPSTEQAVRHFQRDNGLKMDGVVGDQTFGFLQVLGGADG